MSRPQLPFDMVQYTSVLYYRMHGVPNFTSRLTICTLKKIINEIERSGKTKKAFNYFNNDIYLPAKKKCQEMIGLVNAG